MGGSWKWCLDYVKGDLESKLTRQKGIVMAQEKTERELLQDIIKRLDKITGIVAIHGKPQNQQIEILDGLGFDSKTVGLYVGLTGDAVRQRKLQMKRKAAK